MKEKILPFVICFILTIPLLSQNRDKKLSDLHLPETYVTVTLESQAQIEKLGKTFSIDKVFYHAENSNFTVQIWLNQNQYLRFDSLDIPYSTIENEANKSALSMATSVVEMQSWNHYPTYSTYLAMMDRFQSRYPQLCRIDTILSNTPGGHKILAAHISNHPELEENKPAFFYSSSIHGDEVSGYMLMLRLIDYLLSNYEKDSSIQNLVNNIKIWICPLENPDGTYRVSNNLIGPSPISTRGNANGMDLNRSYPPIGYLRHPLEPEIEAMIHFVESHYFVMSANFHGGSEVYNYPFDLWEATYKAHADDGWFEMIGRKYADSCHFYADNNYFTEMNNGVTQGAAWYTVEGSRQDYMNFYQHCREATIELSLNKIPDSTVLSQLWRYNKASLLHYMEECLEGFRGTITDSITGEPVKAFVSVKQHDCNNSEVFSTPSVGNYHRPIRAGNYTVYFYAKNYLPKTYEITVSDDNVVILDVELVRGTLPINKKIKIDIFPNPTRNKINIVIPEWENQNIVATLWDINGKLLKNETIKSETTLLDLSYYATGIYIINFITKEGFTSSHTIIKE